MAGRGCDGAAAMVRSGGGFSAGKGTEAMRLFVAIELGAAIRKALTGVQGALSSFDRTVRWVKPEQMHLTLKFLGEVPDGRVDDICTALAGAAEGCAAFELHTHGAGCFPPRGCVRVVWVGLESKDDVLADCQRRVEAALAGVGFPPERRPFSAHLTVGRVREDRTGDELRRGVERVAVPLLGQRVSAFVLVQSELRPEGARHTRIGEWTLGRGG